MPSKTTSLHRREFLKLSSLTGASIASGSLSLFFSSKARAQSQTPPNRIRAAIIGDFGETTPEGLFPVDRVAPMMKSWDPDFIISLGDNNYILGEASTIDVNLAKNFGDYIYPRGTSPNPDEYPYPATAPAWNRFFPVLGNHDYGDIANDHAPTADNIAKSQPFIDYFGNALRNGSNPINLYNTSTTLPDGSVFSETPTLRYFDFVRGPVHFFMIDNCPATPYGRDPDGIQGQWLQERLAQSTAPWKIVCFHEPPYTSATDGEQIQPARWPFQAWGAHLVLTAHVHNYERLAMADPNSDGPTIPYIVNGAGGFVPEDGFESSTILPGSLARVESYGAQLLEADENSLSLLYYDINNNLRDSFTLLKDSATGQPEIAFATPQVTIADDAGSARLLVQRLGSNTQEVTVQFATVSGTAVAGTNFVAQSGSLTFGPGVTEQTITVELIDALNAPTELHFSVVLSDPASPAVLGFFASADVQLYNTENTPVNNTPTFVQQTFQDILHRAPTPTELSQAESYIESGILGNTTWRKAEYLTNEIFDNSTYLAQEPVFDAARIYYLIQLNLLAQYLKQGMPPTYADLANGVSTWNQYPADDRLWRIAQQYGENILELIFAEGGAITRDPDVFTAIVYPILIEAIPTDQDLAYWRPILGSPVTDQGGFTMLARIATESFAPPPVTGMTPFDFVSSNQTAVDISIVYPGLWRQQLDLNTFNSKVNWARLPLAFFDQVWSALKSTTYTNRFTVPEPQRTFKSTRNLGPDWLETFLGPLYTAHFPWVYHPQHGWLYTHAERSYSDHFWFYDQQLGWVYTTPAIYPFLWQAEGTRWLYYAEGSSQPRYFFDFSDQDWQAYAYSYHLTLTDDLYAKRLPSPNIPAPADGNYTVPSSPCPSRPHSLPA